MRISQELASSIKYNLESLMFNDFETWQPKSIKNKFLELNLDKF
jgi:hypothetical protein